MFSNIHTILSKITLNYNFVCLHRKINYTHTHEYLHDCQNLSLMQLYLFFSELCLFVYVILIV